MHGSLQRPASTGVPAGAGTRRRPATSTGGLYGARYVTADDVAKCVEAFNACIHGGTSGGGNPVEPTSTPAVGRQADDLPKRFSIKYEPEAFAVVSDCHVSGQLSRAARARTSPLGLPEWAQTVTGTLSGLTWREPSTCDSNSRSQATPVAVIHRRGFRASHLRLQVRRDCDTAQGGSDRFTYGGTCPSSAQTRILGRDRRRLRCSDGRSLVDRRSIAESDRRVTDRSPPRRRPAVGDRHFLRLADAVRSRARLSRADARGSCKCPGHASSEPGRLTTSNPDGSDAVREGPYVRKTTLGGSCSGSDSGTEPMSEWIGKWSAA